MASAQDDWVFKGPVAAQELDFSKLNEELILGEVEIRHAKVQQEQKRTIAARSIQGQVRRFLERMRFRRHRTILAADLRGLRAARQTRCSIALQRMCRGWLDRIRYRKLLAAEQQKMLEVAKKGKTSKVKGKDSRPPSGLSPKEAVVHRNMNFITGFRAYLAGKWDEAIYSFDAQNKLKPEGVTTRLIEKTRIKRDGPAAAAKPDPKASKPPPKKKK